MRGILKALAILAVFGVLLWSLQSLGIIGIIGAMVSGTAVGGAILLSRRQDVVPMIRVGIYTLLGAAIVNLFPAIGRHGSVEVGQLILTMMGGIAGALISAVISSMRETPNHKSSDDNP